MNSYQLFFVLSTLVLPFSSACSTTWFLGPSSPTYYIGPCTAVVNDSIYLIPWVDNGHDGTAPLVFQTSTYQWSWASSPPVSVRNSRLISSAAVGNTVYLFSDFGTSFQPGSLQAFNTQNNEWTILFSPLALNCTYASQIPSVVISTMIYLMCPHSYLTFDTLTRELVSYSWVPPFEFYEVGPATTASAVNNLIYITYLNYTELLLFSFDPTNHTTSPLNGLIGYVKSSADSISSAVIGSQIHSVMGTTGQYIIYDVPSASFAFGPPVPGPSAGIVVASANGILCGFFGDQTNSVWTYTPC